MPETIINIPPTIVVRDFAAKLGLPINIVAAELIKNGIMSSMNEEIDYQTAAIIAEDLGKKVTPLGEEIAVPTTSIIDQYLQEEPGAVLINRPPVIVVMGHVDHGKTSLLDAIRQTSVTTGEAGGITQHIGAYQITEHNRLITFIDTPGHEAFSQMRSRGAKIADVAILVVAADDGVKPQTEEALKIIKQTNLPYLVAITKTDKPEASPERVKKELADRGVLLESWGGQVPVANVSAKNKLGLNDLLESILLLADVESDKLKVNPKRAAVGTIIESHVDPQQGPLASVLIQTGTLKIGDDVVVGQVWGKIRSLKNDRSESLKQAPPSTPVQILGLKAAPQVGDILRVAPAEVKVLKKKVKSHQIIHHLQSVVDRVALTKVAKKNPADDEPAVKEEKPEVKKLFLILKTDTLGSSEAILGSLKKLVHEEVSVEIVQRGLGIISEADVLRAESAKAAVYGFHVPVSPKADQLARSRGITIKTFKVIYDLINDVTKSLEILLAPTVSEKEIGQLKVLAVFRNENTYQVVGGKVTAGLVSVGATVRVKRRGLVVAVGKITQLQSNKQNAAQVTSGNECGLKIEGQPVIAVGDLLEAFVMAETKRTLAAP